jgi:heme exporter protein D
MTTLEHREIRGITLKNIVVTVISTVSIVVTVMTSYFQLKSNLQEVRVIQETQNRVNEVRLKILENQVSVLQQEVNEIKNGKKI